MDNTVLFAHLINLVISLTSTEVKMKKYLSSILCLTQNISKVVQYISKACVCVSEKSGLLVLVQFKGQEVLLKLQF